MSGCAELACFHLLIPSSSGSYSWHYKKYLLEQACGVSTRMAGERAITRNKEAQDRSTDEVDQCQRKLQRILRNHELGNQSLSGGVSPFEPKRMDERTKDAILSPWLVDPASVARDDPPLFQCTQCDMIVKGSDPYCPFCGAIFSDGPMAEQQEARQEARPSVERPAIDTRARKEPMARPEMFDIFSMLKTGSRSRDLMYKEALRGFNGSARLLEEIEHLVSDISSLGSDTSRARRLICSAWEACRDGDWNLATTLARQTEELMEPSIPSLVRAEIARARELLSDAKMAGVDISGYVIRVKSAMASLHGGDPDDALRITKELMDSLREDSVSWK